MPFLKARDKLEERIVAAAIENMHGQRLNMPSIEGGDVFYRVALAIDAVNSAIDQKNAVLQSLEVARRGEVGCNKGCDGCCYQAVRVTWPEVILMAYYSN